jgi:hypothetical protein
VFQFLSNTPSYEPEETDSLNQVETKLKNQKVRRLRLCLQAHSGLGGSGSAACSSGGSHAWETGQGQGLAAFSSLGLSSQHRLRTSTRCVSHLPHHTSVPSTGPAGEPMWLSFMVHDHKLQRNPPGENPISKVKLPALGLGMRKWLTFPAPSQVTELPQFPHS